MLGQCSIPWVSGHPEVDDIHLESIMGHFHACTTSMDNLTDTLLACCRGYSDHWQRKRWYCLHGCTTSPLTSSQPNGRCVMLLESQSARNNAQQRTLDSMSIQTLHLCCKGCDMMCWCSMLQKFSVACAGGARSSLSSRIGIVHTMQVQDAAANQVPHLLVVPCLFLTLMLGPAGLLSYFLLRTLAGLIRRSEKTVKRE